MSELAYRYQDNGIYTRTEGNMTRVFFGQPEAEIIAFPGTAATDESLTPRQRELAKPDSAADAALAGSMTPRQRELLKPDSRDMSVQPLESYDQVKAMIDYFEQKGQYREACILVFGFCTGLRISDLLLLKVGDIVSSEDPVVFKPAIDIHEKKTGKRTVSHTDSVLITEAMQEYFSRYQDNQPWRGAGLDSYLFTTIQSRGRRPMNVRTIQLTLADAFAQVCPDLHCSTHTMRKTFVSIFHAFATQATVTGAGINPATACQIALRHASATTTMAYMGTMKSGMLSLRRAVSDFVLGKTVIRSLKTEYSWELIDD